MKLIFLRKVGVVPKRQPNLKKWFEIEKNDFWHRKGQDQDMLGPNSLYWDMPQSCETTIGWVKFWFPAFNVWPRPFFHQKTTKIGQKVIVFFLKNWDKIGPWFCDFWIARWRSFVLKTHWKHILFFQFRPPSWRKTASKLDKNWKKTQTLGTSYFDKNFHFQKNLQTVSYSPWVLTVVQISEISDHIWGS